MTFILFYISNFIYIHNVSYPFLFSTLITEVFPGTRKMERKVKLGINHVKILLSMRNKLSRSLD